MNTIKVKPYGHQVKAFNFATNILEDSGGVALLMDMGTGKTLTSIATVGELYNQDKIAKALVVCPTSVINVWIEEFKKFANFQYNIESLTGASMQKKTDKLQSLLYHTKLKVAVINYESVWRMEKEIMQYAPDIIIADESQKIKNHSAKASRCLHRLGKQAKYRIILTGTPITNNPLDVFSQWKFLNPRIFGESFYAFRNRYCVMGGYYNHEIIKFKHLDELTAKAHRVAYRVTKDEALDLPDQVFLNRYVTLETTAKRIYDKVLKESVAELEKSEITATNILTKLIRLSQLTGGFVKDDEGRFQCVSKAKLKELQEVFEEVAIQNDKKIVVFARFVEEIAKIKRLATEMGIEYEVITGEVRIESRGEIIRKFQEDDKVKLFIAQLQTASTGITLTAADTAVFYSLDYNYANYSQAISRIHRIGQNNTCTYINLVAENTVDEKIIKALENKENIAKTIVDNWKEVFQK